MKAHLFFFLFFISLFAFSQDEIIIDNSDNGKYKFAPINQYKIYTLEKDTTYVDTTLSILKEYKFNLLRRDIFGLQPFSNEGHVYNVLDFNHNKQLLRPNIGFRAKHINYLSSSDIKYYNVPTPVSDLYFKTVLEQGQSLDAFVTINTKPNLNFSIAYKGLRSLGKFINNLSSSGNFRFTTSYFTLDKRYNLNAHFTGQDILNGENGGIISLNEFTDGLPPFNERDRIDVYFRDATSFLKGNRFFIDHSFKLNKSSDNSFVISHQFSHEYEFYRFSQPTVSSRFGNTLSNNVNNKTRFKDFDNKLGIAFQTKKFGDIEFFVEDNQYQYYYTSQIFNSDGSISVPSNINSRINTLGGKLSYKLNDLVLNIIATNSVTNQNVSSVVTSAKYNFSDDLNVQFNFQRLQTLPNLNYTLHQSSYLQYNWYNSFKNEKTNVFNLLLNSKYVNIDVNYKLLDDYLYFANTTNDISNLLVKPFQYTKTIQYASVKASNEFTFGKFGLENTFLYQNVENSDKTLNVPQFTTRNSIYFSDMVFKKAMFIQTGITFNYFSEYNANDYNPILGEFYIQNQTKVGGYPMLDFFINAKVKQMRMFLKAEHFNSSFTGSDYFSAPNYPYRDFLVRFGVVWNFFR